MGIVEDLRSALDAFLERLPKTLEELEKEEREQEWQRREQETFGLDVVN